MDSESSRHDNREIIFYDKIASPRKLQFQYLEEITNGFSDERLLGRGGSGKVYKGVLHDGELMAVKRLMAVMPASQKHFENEVYHLMSLNHPNIVRCIGYCYETQNLCIKYKGNPFFVETAERLLCLEYMPQGSLYNHLADELCGLDWRERYNIISGICFGLHYIHKEWRVNTPIIHLDLKPENILLGDNMVPKIADFGLSRLFGEQQTRDCTKNRDGTLKYPWPSASGTSYPDFVETVLKNWRKRSEAASVETDYQQIRGCLEMGLSCLETDPEKRPATKEIIERLIGWGSTNCQVGSNERSSTLQITSDPREYFVINPHELQFCSASNKQRRCLVQLTNNTSKHVSFSFGVKRARNNYSIIPTSGFLCPRSTVTLIITLEEVREFTHCNDEFLVQIIVVRENRLTSKHITDDSVNMSSTVVHKAKLTVAYVPLAQPPSLLCVGTEETKASDPPQSEEFSGKKNVDTLIRCICHNLGFSDYRPIAACIIYRCLLYWKSFEAGSTNVFDRIIASMYSTTRSQGNDTLAYWLSNSSTLLLLMQRTLKISALGRFTPPRGKSFAAIIDPIIKRNQSSSGSRLIGGKSNHQQVEAKRPALLFKGHITGFLEKVYGRIRDNLVEEISPLLGCCIEAPTIICQALFDHWHSIVNKLSDYLHVLKSNFVPSFLIRKIFTQVFSFIDVQLFNSLLLSECCSLSDGEYIKAGLAKLEQWCIYETEEYAGSSWEELKHIRKAAILLTMREKQKKKLEEITGHFCPAISIPQLYRICTLYRDDRYDTNDVSPLIHVLSSMESLLNKDVNNAAYNNLLLYDGTASIPFTVDDIMKSMTEFELADIDMPPMIREDPCFNFLRQ